MDTKDIFALASDSRFVPGIYNYCNQWCERCPMTARCMVYAMEHKHEEPSCREDESETFWQQLRVAFQQAITMLDTIARERGIDLDAVDTEVLDQDARRRHQEAMDHQLSIAAGEYAALVDRWFEDRESLWMAKRDELISRLQMAVPGDDPARDAAELADARDVVRWYQHQIRVKLVRGLAGDGDPRQLDPSRIDANGSVKVALLGIERSMGAWTLLREALPDDEDSILSILVHLDRLRRAAQEAFPGAREFKRPGFDD